MTTGGDSRYDILLKPARIGSVVARTQRLIDRGARMRRAIEAYVGVQ